MKISADSREGRILKIVGVVLFAAVMLLLSGVLYFHFRKVPAVATGETFSNEDFGLDTWVSPFDADGDGVDDQTDVLQSARDYLATNPKYESRYYLTGYPDDEYGVCTDVVAFALRGAGYDLQALVDADIRANHDGYADEAPDPNIDFRRVRNLLVFFQHMSGDNSGTSAGEASSRTLAGAASSAEAGGASSSALASTVSGDAGALACMSLSCDPQEIKSWQGGDIVIFDNHIAIVSDRRNRDGVCLILHHANPFQLSFEEDRLSNYGEILGHFRLIPPD